MNMISKGTKFELAFSDEGSGFPVLFIHGHPFNRTMWRPQIKSLRWRFRTIAPDLRGYGETPATNGETYTQAQIAQDLVQLLDHLNVEQACVVGLSMGGQIAMELARTFRERVSALVLAATFAQKETPDGIVERNRVADRMVLEGMAPVGTEMLCKLTGPKTLRSMPMLASTVFEMICKTDPQGAASAVRGRALREDYQSALKAFDEPCLIVCGTDDPYTSVADGRALAEMMPNARLEVFPGIGHLPNLEDEDHFNQCLHSFLTSIRLPANPALKEQ